MRILRAGGVNTFNSIEGTNSKIVNNKITYNIYQNVAEQVNKLNLKYLRPFLYIKPKKQCIL